MSDYLLAVVLGVIEGITEFLPVSSTAHIRIAQQLLHIDLKDPFWMTFAIVIQLGAVLCLPFHFYNRLRRYVRSFPGGDSRTGSFLNHPITLVAIAFACTVGPVLLLKKVVTANIENLTVMGAALFIGGVVMWAVDAMFQRPTTDRVESMSIPQAIWIGLVQVLSAVFPGTSRSMATIAAGQTARLSRSTALEFSFLLSIPTMFAACGKELLDAVKRKHEFAEMPAIVWDAHKWVTLGIGFVVSFIVAFVVVAWFLQWVRRRGFVPFAIYRIVLGIAVLAYVRFYFRGG